MAWSSPRTWVDGEIITYALLNTHLSDQLDQLPRLLDRIAYDPGSDTESTATTTATDVDATNVKLTFTMPETGAARVIASAFAKIDSGTDEAYWHFRDAAGTTLLSGLVTASSTWQRVTFVWPIMTGTSGDAKTVKLSHKSSASTSRVGYGGNFGPLVMEAWTVAS